MIPFRYLRPSSLEEARGFLAEHGPNARLLSGGTDLLVRIRAGKCAPSYLIDLKGIPGLSFMRLEEEKIIIGSLTLIGEICRSDLIRRKLPVLAEACSMLGGVQTRNKATLGGNLGNASRSAETACPLLALDGAVGLSGKDGDRVLPLSEFFTGPSKTALRPLEIIKEVIIPLPPEDTGTCFQKLGRRSSMEIGITNVAVAVRGEGNICLKGRIALGAVAPVPLRATAAESLLAGATWSSALLDEVADAAQAACRPISDVRASAWYRREMVRVLVKRALETAWKRSGQ